MQDYIFADTFVVDNGIGKFYNEHKGEHLLCELEWFDQGSQLRPIFLPLGEKRDSIKCHRPGEELRQWKDHQALRQWISGRAYHYSNDTLSIEVQFVNDRLAYIRYQEQDAAAEKTSIELTPVKTLLYNAKHPVLILPESDHEIQFVAKGEHGHVTFDGRYEMCHLANREPLQLSNAFVRWHLPSSTYKVKVRNGKQSLCYSFDTQNLLDKPYDEIIQLPGMICGRSGEAYTLYDALHNRLDITEILAVYPYEDQSQILKEDGVLWVDDSLRISDHRHMHSDFSCGTHSSSIEVPQRADKGYKLVRLTSRIAKSWKTMHANLHRHSLTPTLENADYYQSGIRMVGDLDTFSLLNLDHCDSLSSILPCHEYEYPTVNSRILKPYERLLICHSSTAGSSDIVKVYSPLEYAIDSLRKQNIFGEDRKAALAKLRDTRPMNYVFQSTELEDIYDVYTVPYSDALMYRTDHGIGIYPYTDSPVLRSIASWDGKLARAVDLSGKPCIVDVYGMVFYPSFVN